MDLLEVWVMQVLPFFVKLIYQVYIDCRSSYAGSKISKFHMRSM